MGNVDNYNNKLWLSLDMTMQLGRESYHRNRLLPDAETVWLQMGSNSNPEVWEQITPIQIQMAMQQTLDQCFRNKIDHEGSWL